MNSRWTQQHLGGELFQLLDLKHPEVERRIIDDMSAGTAVFYDRRWKLTTKLNDWLADHRELIRGKRVLVLGAGIGSETVVLGKYASHLWINDLSLVALELCGEQLQHNGITNFTPLPGRYETLDLPAVDLIVACFLVYNTETLAAMKKFLAKQAASFLLVNELLPDFQTFLKSAPHELLFEWDDAFAVWFSHEV